MADFKVEVPITVGGSGGSGGSGSGGTKEIVKSNERVAKETAKLRTNIVESLGITKILSEIFSDVYQLVRPLVKVLSILVFLVFMPLMKPIAAIAKALGMVAKKGAEKGGGVGVFEAASEAIVDSVGPTISTIIAGILIVFGVIILAAFTGWFAIIIIAIMGLVYALAEPIESLISWMWEILVVAWNWFVGQLATLWEILVVAWNWFLSIPQRIWEGILKPAWNWFVGIGELIWTEILKPSWEWFLGIGEKIWDIIKSPFEWLADKISKFSFFGGRSGSTSSASDSDSEHSSISSADFILRPNGQIIKTASDDFIFGTKNPEKMFGNSGGGTTININNPVVREEADIRKLTNEISRALQSQMKRRLS